MLLPNQSERRLKINRQTLEIFKSNIIGRDVLAMSLQCRMQFPTNYRETFKELINTSLIPFSLKSAMRFLLFI